MLSNDGSIHVVLVGQFAGYDDRRQSETRKGVYLSFALKDGATVQVKAKLTKGRFDEDDLDNLQEGFFYGLGVSLDPKKKLRSDSCLLLKNGLERVILCKDVPLRLPEASFNDSTLYASTVGTVDNVYNDRYDRRRAQFVVMGDKLSTAPDVNIGDLQASPNPYVLTLGPFFRDETLKSGLRFTSLVWSVVQWKPLKKEASTNDKA